jgi:AmmeMemoRadiSam system protein B
MIPIEKNILILFVAIYNIIRKKRNMYILFFLKKIPIGSDIMKVRKSSLAGTWYPGRQKEIDEFLVSNINSGEETEIHYAAIVPHAGWVYSGKTAAEAAGKVCRGKDLIVVIGGHLPAGYPILAAYEDYIEIPDGKVKNRKDLIKKLSGRIEIEEDNLRDNTVEVVMPMAAYFAKNADFMWLRAPSDHKAVKLAEELYALFQEDDINAGVIGSTDLTHYGRNYSFTPKGSGPEALKWVKEINDAEIIKHMTEMEPEKLIEHSEKNRSACSAGAAAAAVKFAKLNNVQKGVLTGYTTSYDITPADSFVGYAGIIF